MQASTPVLSSKAQMKDCVLLAQKQFPLGLFFIEEPIWVLTSREKLFRLRENHFCCIFSVSDNETWKFDREIGRLVKAALSKNIERNRFWA